MKLRSHKRKEKVLPNRKRALALELQVFCTQAVDGRKEVKLRKAPVPSALRNRILAPLV